MHKGISAERFEIPLGGRRPVLRRGGNPPAPACPWGKRKRARVGSFDAETISSVMCRLSLPLLRSAVNKSAPLQSNSYSGAKANGIPAVNAKTIPG